MYDIISHMYTQNVYDIYYKCVVMSHTHLSYISCNVTYAAIINITYVTIQMCYVMSHMLTH
jgi:hypothetical protein